MRLKVLDDFPVKIHYPLSWGDMDLFGHVNNVAYLKYFENGHTEYLQIIGFWKMFHETGIGGVISELSCNYLCQLVYPDIIEIGTRISEISEFEIKFEYYIYSEKSGVAAYGKSGFTFYDYAKKKKTRIPTEIQTSIYQIEKHLKAENK